MIGMVIVAHGRLAHELLAALEHVVGSQVAVHAVGIGPDDDMEARRGEIIEAARSADTGKGTILLTDMFGGTPSNLAMSVLGFGRFDVIAGVNLPLLIKLAKVRERADLVQAVALAAESGRKYIQVASQVLGDAK